MYTQTLGGDVDDRSVDRAYRAFGGHFEGALRSSVRVGDHCSLQAARGQLAIGQIPSLGEAFADRRMIEAGGCSADGSAGNDVERQTLVKIADCADNSLCHPWRFANRGGEGAVHFGM